jgi:ribose 5-phosphate isomerase A
MITIDEAKKAAAVYAVNFLKQGMCVGLGSGSTIKWLIVELGKMVAQGFEVKAVPSSLQTKQLADELYIPLVDLNEVSKLDITIDGADEIDKQGNLIKGGGGALLQEKIVAAASSEFIIVADYSKQVNKLGKFPLPVEVIPFGWKQVEQKLVQSGLCKDVSLRKKNNGVFITDHHHYILDCYFEQIEEPFALNSALHHIPGVVETGLFINMAGKAVIGYEDGRIEVLKFR